MNHSPFLTPVGLVQRSAIFVVIASLVFGAVSRSIASDQRPPVPYYSEETVAHSGFNVFLDHHTGDGIIIWDQPNEDGTKLRIPVELARHIEPELKTEVQYLPSPRKFHYGFTLTNGRAARQAINFFYFVGLQDRERYDVSTPDHWHVSFPRRTAQFDRQYDQSAPIDRALNLFLPDADTSGTIGVPPGRSRSGLQILSSDRPGLIDVYAQGKTEILAMPTEPSEKIRAELLRISYFPYNFRHIMAVAPKYDGAMPDSELAESYQKDLENLRIFEGQPVSSAFFQRAAQLLAKEKTTTNDFVDFSGLMDLAKTSLERDLANSIAIAFSSVRR